MSIFQIILLAMIQGAAELLPVSSSAHVIVAEKLMGLNPSSPEMTFLLVMLHTGTMFAVLVYFWRRWCKIISAKFIMAIVIATGCTGVIGLFLKKLIEHILSHGHPKAEIELLFSNLTLVSMALALVGLLIIIAGTRRVTQNSDLDLKHAAWIGVVQGLCLPFRGFSRSGATISTALLQRIPQALAEDFSFALAVVLTPPVIVLEAHRLMKANTLSANAIHVGRLVGPGLLGMVFSFLAGLLALVFLSALLENRKWKYFGFYCIAASIVVFMLR